MGALDGVGGSSAIHMIADASAGADQRNGPRTSIREARDRDYPSIS